MVNIENSDYDKKIYYKKKNNIVKYAKSVERLIVKNMHIIILKMKRKNYIVDNIKKMVW